MHSVNEFLLGNTCKIINAHIKCTEIRCNRKKLKDTFKVKIFGEMQVIVGKLDLIKELFKNVLLNIIRQNWTLNCYCCFINTRKSSTKEVTICKRFILSSQKKKMLMCFKTVGMLFVVGTENDWTSYLFLLIPYIHI